MVVQNGPCQATLKLVTNFYDVIDALRTRTEKQVVILVPSNALQCKNVEVLKPYLHSKKSQECSCEYICPSSLGTRRDNSMSLENKQWKQLCTNHLFAITIIGTLYPAPSVILFSLQASIFMSVYVVLPHCNVLERLKVGDVLQYLVLKAQKANINNNCCRYAFHVACTETTC